MLKYFRSLSVVALIPLLASPTAQVCPGCIGSGGGGSASG